MSTNTEQVLQPPMQTAWQWAVCPECCATFPVTQLTDAELRKAKRTRLAREREREAFLELVATLSPRERSVMDAIARGIMPSDLAKQLKLDVKTVNTYRTRVQEKLALRSNADIAVAVHKAGLLE
jgi:DNA-binding NarL/FixJ family response regulator